LDKTDMPTADPKISEYQQRGRAQAAEEQSVLGTSGDDFLLRCAATEEAGDARLFISLHKNKIVFDHAQGLWHDFNGHFWTPFEVEEPLEMVGRLVEIYADAAKKQFFRKETAIRAGKEKEADQAEANERIFLKKMVKLQRRLHRTNVLALAAAGKVSLGISGKQWDLKPLLFPCVNGILDLEAESFRDGRPDDFILKYSPCPWEGFDAPAPRWKLFIREILGDDEKAAFFQRLLGSFIVGVVTEAVFPVLWGPGRNGKSLCLETLAYVLGPLAGPVQSELLMQQKQPRSAAAPSPELMALRGLRLAWASESDEGRRLNSGKIKWLTGNDSLVARGPFDRRLVSFKPSHNLLLLTNFRPTGNPQDLALWARVISLRFPYSFVDSPTKENERLRDPGLADELKREGPGILSWLVSGYYQWLEKGLSPPPSILAETSEYRAVDDSIGHFLKECSIEHPDFFCRASELHDAYATFCEAEGFKPRGKKTFFQYLQETFNKAKDKNGIYYKGLCLKD
jgi:putative DNA primase/helicase